MKIESLKDLEDLMCQWVSARESWVKTIEMTKDEYEQMCQSFDKLRVDEIMEFEKANQTDDVITHINRSHFKPATPNIRLSNRLLYGGFNITIKVTEDEMPQEAI